MPEVEVVQDEADKHQFDASVVLGKKPGRWYRWGRNDQRNLIMRKLEGYEICTDPDVRSALGANTRMKKGEDVDDTITFGDMVLLETSMENHERREELDRRKILRRTQGVMNQMKQKIREAGGEVIEEHGLTPATEGKGYGKGFTAKDLERELNSAPEVAGADRPSWRNRRE